MTENASITSLILAIVLAIVLGLVANLLTPKIRLLLSKRSNRSKWNHGPEKGEEFKMIENLTSSTQNLVQHLFAVIFKVLAIVAIVSVVTDVMALVFDFVRYEFDFPLYWLIRLVDIIGAVVVIRLVFGALKDLEMIKNFLHYQSLMREKKDDRDDD